MRTKIRIFPLVILVALALLISTQGVKSSPAELSPSTPKPLSSQSTSAKVFINEAAPLETEDTPEWVELRVALYNLYLPMIHTSGATLSTIAPEASPENPLNTGIDISGWQIRDEDGNAYTIPDELPPLSSNGYVLIIYDGKGPEADDYDLSDGVAELHTPPDLVGIFEDLADQVALYDGETIIDFVAYGADPGEDDDPAVSKGIWQPSAFTAPTEQIPGGVAMLPGGSFGLYPGGDQDLIGDWAIYKAEEVSPGAVNNPPAPLMRTPPDGIHTSDHRIPFGWSTIAGAESYHFQLASDLDFNNLVIDLYTESTAIQPTSDLPDGTYYYRLRAKYTLGDYSIFSAPGEVTIFTVEANLAPNVTNLLGVTPQLQHKDTFMLCVDGGNRTGQDRWDSAHESDGDWIIGNGTPVRANAHDDMYCTRAAISMIVDFHGGSLSQDRISYYTYDGGPPEGDLGHGLGMWPDEMCTWGSGTAGDDDALTWAMNGNTNTCSRGKPTFAQIRGWIDAGRPCIFVENNDQHSTVMDGYNTQGNLVHRVDPWTASSSWVSFASWNVSEYHCPVVATPRSDESSLTLDSDGDGIVDFDEINRLNTTPNTPDFDEDWVNDKWDLFDVYFNSSGSYGPKAAGVDMDSDGLRKEVDPDNDGGGTVDGCEDSDYDGRVDTGETSNFNASDDAACTPVFGIRSPTKSAPGEVGDKSAPDKLLIRLLTSIPPAAGPLTLSKADFDVQIGGQNAKIMVAPYLVGDEYWLIVQPPTKTTAGYYDLKATLQGTQTDTEAKAVHYSDKGRTEVDEVLVVDNSGSMSLHNKMPSAKNAARAFIDRWLPGDMVSLVAFSTTVSTPFPLTTVTGTATLTSARTAVNSMLDSPPGFWYTAIGKGLLEAKKQLANGNTTHTQSIVLLGDGMENESPLWADPKSGVQTAFTNCNIKVHTVAIGPSLATWRSLLQDISNKACNGDGLAWHTSGGSGSPTLELAEASPLAAGFPDDLGNRLADIYLSIAEHDTRDQRLWEATGKVTMDDYQIYFVDVPMDLPEMVWTLNWDQGPLELHLYAPDGTPFDPGNPRVEYIKDRSHEQYRVPEPMQGKWRVEVHNLGPTPSSEYLVVLSGHTSLQMWTLFGLIPIDRAVGMMMPINVALADFDAVVGATVSATIKAPLSDFNEQIMLYDDGKHDDGDADDGLYGGHYLLQYPGSYTVKTVASGQDNNREPFRRYQTRSFYVIPRVAYVYNGESSEDAEAAYAFMQLLHQNGFIVELYAAQATPGDTDFSGYELILVSPLSGDSDNWGDPDAYRAVSESGKPILGLGEGGYAYFGQLGLPIGYPNGYHGEENSVFTVNPEEVVWHDPYPIPIAGDQTVMVYTTTQHVGLYLPDPLDNVTYIGQEVGDPAYYILVAQDPHFTLWGFQGPPGAMTPAGKDLFINMIWFAMKTE
jgi:Mg-chelatase subunit ChlD